MTSFKKTVCAVLALLLGGDVYAADLPLVRQGARTSVVVHPRRSSHALFRHQHRYVIKLIGMPCGLTPDAVVALNWNGPQCRYVDNVIVTRRVLFVDAMSGR